MLYGLAFKTAPAGHLQVSETDVRQVPGDLRAPFPGSLPAARNRAGRRAVDAEPHQLTEGEEAEAVVSFRPFLNLISVREKRQTHFLTRPIKALTALQTARILDCIHDCTQS